MSKHSSALKASSAKLRAKLTRKSVVSGKRKTARNKPAWKSKGLQSSDTCPAMRLTLFYYSPGLYLAVMHLPVAKRVVKGGRQKRFPRHNRRRALRSQGINLE